MRHKPYRNPTPELGDLIQYKDVRMDGAVIAKHLGVIYEISESGTYALIEWIDNKRPPTYNDLYGYSITHIQQEYDVFSIIAKASNAKSR